MKPYYERDRIQIFHADCREILPLLPKVDLIFTSPPYNLSNTTGGGFPARHGPQSKSAKWSGALLANGYDGFADNMAFPEYEEWQRSVLAMCWDALSDRGAIFYNHKPRPQADGLWIPLKVNPGLPIRQIVTWARAGGINFSPTHYVPTYEWIMVFAKPAFRLRDKSASGLGDVWYVPQEGKTQHPCPFPIGLPIRAISTTGEGLVCDPFVGSGTTLVAAKRLGRPAIGIETAEAYCEIAARRLEAERLTLFEHVEATTGNLFGTGLHRMTDAELAVLGEQDQAREMALEDEA